MQILKEIQKAFLSELPLKYQKSDVDALTHLQLEEHLKQSYEDIKRKRVVHDDVLYQLEVGKQHALEEETDDVINVIKDIIPKICDLADLSMPDTVKLEDIQDLK